MTISVITLFPDLIKDFFNISIPKRAQEEKKIELQIVDLRKFGLGRHKTVDDKPYGGGVGMVLKVDVMDTAIQASRKNIPHEKVVLLDPVGKTYSQIVAEEYSELEHLILICGHYEGFDARIRSLVDEEISIGDFVLSGGEIPALAIIDSVIRLIPGVLKKDAAVHLESFSELDGERILEYPQYTRPEVYKDMKVPEILLSGDHKKIQEFQQQKAREKTKEKRPELLKKGY